MHRRTFSRKTLGIPYAIFLLLFVAMPLLVLVYYAFTNGQGEFTVMNLVGFFTNPNTLGTLFYSFGVAIVTTVVCLLLAYPTAYILAISKWKSKTVILLLFVMPMWINFSLRITALKEILTFIEGNLAYHPFLNTVIGMTYDFTDLYDHIPSGWLAAGSSKGPGGGRDAGILKSDIAIIRSGNYQRRINGVSSGNDQLCSTGYAV